jgi:hypothetical protein
MFSFSPLIWLYSVGGEVFSLNNALVSIVVYLSVRVGVFKSWVDVYLGALFCGLALCNQHTAILFEIPLILWILWIFRTDLTAFRFVSLAVCFFIGLSPYIYLVYSAINRPQFLTWVSLILICMCACSYEVL